MIPMKFLYGNFIELPVDIDLKDLKKLSKGKRRRTPTDHLSYSLNITANIVMYIDRVDDNAYSL